MIKKILLFITISLFFFGISLSDNSDIYKKIDLFGEVLEKINKEYVNEIDQSKSMDAAINGLLQSLDPYSAYMTPESFEGMQTETSGKFGGLGIEVGMEAGVVKVISPIDNTPASIPTSIPSPPNSPLVSVCIFSKLSGVMYAE